MEDKEKILIIDDEIGPREALRMILKDRHIVKTASDAEEGLRLLSEDVFGIVILDIRMPRIDGITALKEIKSLYNETEVIMVTAYASVETARRAIQLGAIDYLIKPFDKDEVTKIVEKGVQKRNQRIEQKEEQVRLRDLVHERTKELQITEKMLRELFENANDGIIIMDEKGRIVDINQKACEIYGYRKEEMKGKNVEMLEFGENGRLLKERIRRLLNGEAMVFETEHTKKDGTNVIIEVSEKAIQIDGNVLIQSFQRDITERKKLQEQLSHSQKMESIGTLAGGIAHDFNNILTAILGYTEMVKGKFSDDDTFYKYINIIEKSAQKGTSLARKLLTVSRKEKLDLKDVDMNVIIEETLDILKRVIAKSIDIEFNLEEQLPKIKADPTHIQQVIMNLALNARDAMPGGGTLNIQTERVSRKQGALHGFRSDSDFVKLAVSDTGKGINGDIQRKIFDPFFTTKEAGKGTGLGLYMVHTIVKNHRGYVHLDSMMNRGTTFNIYLPVVEEGSGETEVLTEQDLSGTSMILVIDDERSIRALVKDMLEPLGYKVRAAASGKEGINIYKDHKDEIAIVLLDMIMPKMNGTEVFRRLQSIDPNVKVVLCSGYGHEDHTLNSNVKGFVQKPFNMKTLGTVIKNALN